MTRSGRRPAASALLGVALHRRITVDTAASGAWIRALSLGLRPQSELPNTLLRRLYNLRLGADYRLDVITAQDAEWAIQVTQEIISLAAQEGVQDVPKSEED